MSEKFYVYGVVPRSDREAVERAEGPEVELVEHDGVVALTQRISGDELHAVRALRSHWKVLQDACEAATVVPLRFGTVLESERAVREQLLDANVQRLDELFRRLRGCVQMTVKGTYVEPSVLQKIISASPALSALAARVRSAPPAAGYYDRIKLGEAIATAITRRRSDDTARALDLLEPAAEMVHAEDPAGELDAFNLACLVKRTAEGDFGARVRQLTEAAGPELEIQYVGPLPPFSFADEQLVAEAA